MDGERVAGTLRDLRTRIQRAPAGAQLRILDIVDDYSGRLAGYEDAYTDLRLITRDGAAYAALVHSRVELPERGTCHTSRRQNSTLHFPLLEKKPATKTMKGVSSFLSKFVKFWNVFVEGKRAFCAIFFENL